MTVTTTISSKTFQGNNTAKAFPCGFQIFQSTDARVFFVNPSTGTSTPAVLNTDYTLSGVGNSNGFTVNTTNPVPVGTNLYVERVLPLTQLTDFTNQGEFFPTLHQAAIDRLCMLIQQVANVAGLTLSLPPGLYPEPSNVFPVPSANQLVGWNSDGTGLTNIPPGDGGVTLFAQPAAGAVARPIISKVQETVSITDFMTAAQIADSQSGVAPTIDSSAAIQAAANYAESMGRKLVVPAGRYLCSNVTLFNVTLEGAGAIDQGYDSTQPGIGSLAHSSSVFYVTDTSHSLFNVESGCHLSKFNVYYPNQTGAAFTANGNAPTVYPATINIPTNNENIHLENIGCSNAYQFLQIGSQSSTNAVGRITLENLRVYSIWCDIFVDVLRDILHINNCAFTYGWWDTNECGSVVNSSSITNLASWTAKNGRCFILETTDGVACSNCFFFAKAAVIQAIAGSESQPGLGQSQYNRFTNCLFDGCSAPVQAVFGGYWASTLFNNCIFSDLSPTNFPGTWPDSGITNDSSADSSDMTFNNCLFIGGREHQVRMVNNCARLAFHGCTFTAWQRYSGASEGSCIYLDAGGTTHVLVDGCVFDPSGSGSGTPVAINAVNCSSLLVTGCKFLNCYKGVNVASTMAGPVTVANCVASNTGSANAVYVDPSATGAMAVLGSNQFDKPPNVFGSPTRCRVDATATALSSVSAGPTNVTFSNKNIDTLSAFNASTGTFTVPFAGRFRFNLMVAHDYSVTAGDAWKLSIAVNGTDKLSSILVIAAAQPGTLRITADITLNAGQAITFPIERKAGTDSLPLITGDSQLTSLQIEALE